jgi:Luciferase-like monooxygenase
MSPGKLGVWAGTDGLSAADTAAFARRVEAWGYGALWFPEAVGREAFSAAAWLLANTSKLIIASGIANIYARDACSAAAAAAPYQSVPPASLPKTVLSAELADGAHPYNVTPEHTRQARVLLGAGKLLCDEKAIRARIDEHWQAGADHVCVQAIGPTVQPDEHLLALLAPGP